MVTDVYNARDASALVMRVRCFIKLLARRDRYREPIFFRCQRTRRIGRDRARGVVGPVEVEHYAPVYHWIGFEKTSARIRLALRGQIVENKEESLRWITVQVGKPHLLSVDLKHNGARHRRRTRIAQH